MIGTTTMNSRRTTLLIALLLAAVTGWLTLSYVRSIQQQNSLGGERTAYVATAEIPARSTITAGMIARVTRPAAAVETDAVINPNDAIGQVALITIPAGAQVTESKLGRAADAGLPVRLEAGKRAVSIEVDKVKGVSGLMQPGDRVDIISVPPAKSMNDQPPPAATILRGIRILAIGDSLEYNSATPSPQEQQSTTVTLEVTPKQADLLAMADESTKLRLALRPPREPLNSQPSEALRFATAPLVASVAPAAQPVVAQPQVPAPAAKPEHRPPTGIMIIDGDRIEYGRTSEDDSASKGLGGLFQP